MTFKNIKAFFIYFTFTVSLHASWHDFDDSFASQFNAAHFDKDTYEKAYLCIMHYLHEQHDFNDDSFDIFNSLSYAQKHDYSETLTHRFLERFSPSWSTFFDDGKKDFLKRVHRQMLRDLYETFNNDWQSFFNHEQDNWPVQYNYF